MGDVIEIKGLTKVYRAGVRRKSVQALNGLDLSVVENEIFGFLGPNGAGKTTTMKILVGLLFPTSGAARVLERPIDDLSVRAQTGFLPESPHFYDYLTSRELLDLCCRLFGMSKARRISRIKELLAKVGLEHAADLQIRKHSLGMRQRLGIAQSLVNDPKLLFLDEPMSGLDPVGRRSIREMVRDLKSEGKTIFFSSHILSDAELLCDRVGIIANGRLVNVGKLREILAPQKSRYEAVVDSVNDESSIARLSDICEELTQRDGRLHLVLRSREGLQQMQRIVVEAGGIVESLSRMRTTLEDHFIEFMGADSTERGEG